MLKSTKGSKAYGNDVVVTMLERWLKEAKKGKVSHATVTLFRHPDLVVSDFAGTFDAFPVNFVLDRLKLNMIGEARVNTRPTSDQDIGADNVCYNVGDSPLSFDFLAWLIDAEMTRVREGAPAPLKVGFTYGQDGKRGLNNEYRQGMYVNVIRPLLTLIGAVEDPDAVHGRSKHMFVYRDVTKAAKSGEQVPTLRASEAARKMVDSFLAHSKTPVVVTLRESKDWAHRNSNIANWLKFADDLKTEGENVIFVRDTAMAGEPLLNHQTCPIAALNIDIRMAMYERAKCNIFVPNGPWNLALFGDRPWLMFNEVNAKDPFFPNTPKFWIDSHGINVGEQFPWCRSDQRIVWQRDDYDVLTRAWQDCQPLLAKAA